MESILPILINTLFGAGGGWLGNMIKKNGLGMLGNLVAGGAGGNLLPLLGSAAGLLGGGAATGGGFDLMTAATALLGGGAGSLLGGLFNSNRKNLDKRAITSVVVFFLSLKTYYI